ncbi:hypothetical protein QBC44DRAFT_368649 [Cladorrhinum sp. PSN332]|nr:hypothetical protein QBC44DRAFT_368649 [Cladorrhinum sp. PSN332]
MDSSTPRTRNISPKLALTTHVISISFTSVALLSVILRFVSRRLQFGPSFVPFSRSHSGRTRRGLLNGPTQAQGFQLDDYLMILTLTSLCVMAWASNEIAVHDSNYLLDEEDIKTYHDHAEAVWGSKMLVVLEEAFRATLWGVKGCFTALYWRMTTGLKEQTILKSIATYCILGYVMTQVLYLFIYSGCTTYRSHLLTSLFFHLTSDLLLLSVPLPIILKVQLPPRRKTILLQICGLGLIVCVLGILNRSLNLLCSDPNYDFLIWYNAEASTAVIVANVPCCWTLLSKVFRLDPWTGRSRRVSAVVLRSR